MFEVQLLDLPAVDTPAIVMFDNCASATLITHTYAEQAGFQGKPVEYFLKVTDYPPQRRATTLYTLILRDIDGVDHEILALGINEISDVTSPMNLRDLKHLFPQAAKEV